MKGPSYPEYVDRELKNIRSGFVLKWNPIAVVEQGGHFDADGTLVPPVMGGRYELWDTDVEGGHYRVMIVRDPSGAYMEPGERLLTKLRMMDPARWGGDVSKMLTAMIDEENDKLQDISKEDFNEWAEAMAKWWADHAAGRILTSVTADIN